MFQLRPYQQAACNEAKAWMRTSIDPALIDASPAAGKSYMVAELAGWLREISGGKRVLCLQPNSKLVKQNLEKFLLTGEYASVFSASAGSKSTRHPVVFATPLTVKNSISRFCQGGDRAYAGVLIDECHEITPTIRAIIDEMRLANPNLRIFGFTGTPYRLGFGYIYQIGPDGRSNGDDTCREPYFVKCVYRVSPNEMLEQGFITPMEVGEINAESYDTSGIELLPNGTLNHSTVERAFEGHGRRTAGAVADAMAQYHARGLVGGIMYFAATVKHAEEVLASLPPDNSAMSTGEKGILFGKEASDDAIVKAYRTGKVRHLVSVGKYTTGFDIDHTVMIVTLRYSESAALITQILGRAWRLHPDKHKCVWLDYAGNYDRHFDIDIYNPKIEAKKAAGPGIPIEAECPDCNYVNEFSLQPDYAEYQRDKHGYALDVFGDQLQGDFGAIPVHYGRRCFGMVRSGPRGEYERCNYRWNGKDCEECGETNDIAARYCYVCKAEIVNPNDKLIADFKAMKRDPTQPQTDKIVSLSTVESVSHRGNKTLRVDFVTEYRQFSIWLMPEPTNNIAASAWTKWQETGGDPKTVSYVRESDSQFWRVLAYNKTPDDENLPEAAIQETEKLRKYAA